MNPNKFKSEDAKVLASAVKEVVDKDRIAKHKKHMREGISYYKHRHDIEDLRFFYVDNEGTIHEETARSNIKIAHSFFTELSDQKTQYLLSNPVEFTSEQERLQDYLDEYIDEEFQLMLQEVVDGGNQKGYEFVYTKLGQERLSFAVADSQKVVQIYDENNQLIAIVRYYDSEIYKQDKPVKVTKAELWDSEKVHYFVSDENKAYMLDDSYPINPLYLNTIVDKEKGAFGQSLGAALNIDDFIPFLRYDNNKYQTTDLQPIKAIIDDYDLMACSMSNNLQDYDQPFFAVKGFNSDNYENLLTNLRSRGAVGTGENGGIEVHTVNIPVEARKEKLRIDKEAIYKFGMGFDSSQVGDGNITNVVIQSRYTLLDLKCNKAEIRLRKLLKRILKLIVADINRRFNTSYTTDDLEIIIKRSTMVDEKEKEDIEKVKAEAKQVAIQTILEAAPHLPSETVLEMLCEQFDLDFEEVKDLLELEPYTQGLSQGTDNEVIENATAGQVGQGA